MSPEVPSEVFGGRPAIRARVAAERLGETASEVASQKEALRERERLLARQAADDMVLQEAEAKLSLLETDLLNLAKSRSGKDALPLPEEIRQSWTKGQEEIERGLTSVEQRMRFRTRAIARQASLERAVLQHVDQERSRFDNESFESFLANERSAAISSFDNEERIKMAVASIYAASESYAARNGKSKEWAQAVASRAAGDAIRGAIWANLNFWNVERAESYFEAYRNLLDADSIQKISDGIERRKFIQSTHRVVDAIMGSGPSTQMDALEQARQIQNPELRAAAETLIKQRWSEREEALQELRRQKVRQALETVERTGRLEEVPEETWQGLDPQDRAKISEFARSLRRPADEMREAQAFTEFSGLTRSAKAALTEEDLLLKYRPRMSEATYREIVREWRAARDSESGKEGAEGEYSRLMTPKEIVRAELQRYGMYPANEKDVKDRHAIIYADVLRRTKTRLEWHAARGEKQPIESVVRQIINEARRKEDVLEAIARFPQTRKAIVNYADIPEDRRRTLEAVIKRMQKVATRELVEQLYAAELADDPDLLDQILQEAK